MKLIYIANSRIPTEKAHGIQIMKQCEAFADAGIEVELVIPMRRNPIRDDIFKYHGVKKIFKITKLPCLDLVGIIPKLGFWIQTLTFSKLVTWYTLFNNADIIYSRDQFVLYGLSFIKKNLVWEVHRGEKGVIAKRLIRKCKKIIVISNGLKDLYVQIGANSKKILVAPDAVDIEKFKVKKSKVKIREELDLPLDGKVIMYTGHLYDWKGASVLLQAASNVKCQMSNVKFVFVGGTDSDVPKFKQRAKDLDNVLILGHKSHKDIPKYLAVADVLVLPNSGKYDISKKYTSPMKMFEYMASGRPIVASDLPSIREILSESNSVLVGSDDPSALVEGIIQVLNDENMAKKISAQALVDVAKYSWIKRAEKIISSLM